MKLTISKFIYEPFTPVTWFSKSVPYRWMNYQTVFINYTSYSLYRYLMYKVIGIRHWRCHNILHNFVTDLHAIQYSCEAINNYKKNEKSFLVRLNFIFCLNIDWVTQRVNHSSHVKVTTTKANITIAVRSNISKRSFNSFTASVFLCKTQCIHIWERTRHVRVTSRQRAMSGWRSAAMGI